MSRNSALIFATIAALGFSVLVSLEVLARRSGMLALGARAAIRRSRPVIFQAALSATTRPARHATTRPVRFAITHRAMFAVTDGRSSGASGTDISCQ